VNADVVKVLPVPAKVREHAIHLPLLGHDCCYAALGQHGHLVQPAVGPGCTKQAALVVCCTALQHRQQAGVWQCQQQGRIILHSSYPLEQHS
jgi:hypothetical protein